METLAWSMAGDRQEADDSTGTTALVAWPFLTVKPTSERSDVRPGLNYRRRLKFVKSLLVTPSRTLRHTGRTNTETVAIVGHFIE
ncbi:hypothetical protein BPOR_0178g00120 [Botrytis porri]|uniref:Uncharacterized protein n=1 Tax=Botrytis porri TaxID=87229 RepID=A0A4Z1KUH7_9HELO|nr:hypothetical protein BPOR_0178g00120 [Botrytis porri]